MDICLESFDYNVVNEGRIKEAFKAVLKKLVDRLKIILDGIQQIVAKIKDQKYKELYEKISNHAFKLTKEGEEGTITGLKRLPAGTPGFREKVDQLNDAYDELAAHHSLSEVICDYVDELKNRYAEEPSDAIVAVADFFNSMDLSVTRNIKYSDLAIDEYFFEFHHNTSKASEIQYDKLKIKSAKELIKKVESGSFFVNEKEVTKDMQAKMTTVIRAYIVLWTAYLNANANDITVLKYVAKHIDIKAKAKDLDESDSKEESFNFCSIK